MTTPITIQTLHVEDDRVQHAFVARHLATLSEYDFQIQTATNENDAMEAFGNDHFDLVILDYQLTQGDGLNCLARMRKLDPMVPVIAVSGVATSEIAAKLIEAGADDYLGKKALDGPTLKQSVRNALVRANAFKSRFAALSENMDTFTETPVET